MAKAANLETWVQLFNQHWQWGMGVWQFPAWQKEDPYPVLSPWHLVDLPQEGLMIMERNPYYFKVDLEGNQLPYLDNMRFDYITTGDAAKLKLAQNELDSLGMHDVTMAEYAFYKENERPATSRSWIMFPACLTAMCSSRSMSSIRKMERPMRS